MLLHQNADAFNQVMAQKNEAHKVLSATRVYIACVAEKHGLVLADLLVCSMVQCLCTATRQDNMQLQSQSISHLKCQR